MPRVQWPLLRNRPRIEIKLLRATDGQVVTRQLIADTGAGSALAPVELILAEADCVLCGGSLTLPVVLRGAFRGSFPTYVIRVQLPALGFDQPLRAVGLPTSPAGFGGLACFRFLNRFNYGNFGNSGEFGLEL